MHYKDLEMLRYLGLLLSLRLSFKTTLGSHPSHFKALLLVHKCHFTKSMTATFNSVEKDPFVTFSELCFSTFVNL